MLDINFIRENPDIVKHDLKKRYMPDKEKLVDDLIMHDDEWRRLKQQSDSLRHKRNQISEEINRLVKEKKDASNKIKEVKELPDKIRELEQKLNDLRSKIDHILLRLPNILDKSVPIGKDASHNKIVRKWGKIPKFKFELRSHADLIESLGLADFEAGRRNTGQGFNYIMSDMAMLDLALQRYGIEFLLKRKFTPVVPPMLLNRETLSGAVDLSTFEEVVYKIQDEDLYLIGTAEHSLVTMLKNRVIKKEKLPVRVCAATPCFRKEIGGHGVDTKGLFRMHQFNKVEQVVFTHPKDSYKMLHEMQSITEKFFQSLKIPYRLIEICSGDLGGKFSKQYDIEAWFPRQNEYKEITSAGNCTDYQARRLNIKFDDKGKREYVHILNNTMVATSRAMVAIIENYQLKDGSIKIPAVLKKYMNGISKMESKI